jgi:hypothetical protein
MTAISQLVALRPAMQRVALPERVILALRDPVAPATPLPLPQQQTAAAGVICGGFFVIFAAIALQTISAMDLQGVRSVFDLMFLLFQLLWVVGWSVGVGVLFLLTVFLLFFREVARVSADRLQHIVRLGPARIILEFDLPRISNLRLEGPAGSDLVRLRFDYEGSEQALGNRMSRETAQVCVHIIEGAMGRLSTDAQSRAPGYGLDITNWLRRLIGKRIAAATADPPELPSAPGETLPALRDDALSSATLVVANLAPVAGVLFLHWRLSDIMVLFWAENAILGVYNIARLIRISRWGSVLLVPFFTAHYGGFMVAHFLFVYYLFVRGADGAGPGGEPSALAALSEVFVPLWPALLMLALGHGVDYVTNFLGKREWARRTASQQMQEPYKRIILLHVTIIFGGWLTLAVGAPVLALVLLCVLKLTLDLKIRHPIR